MAGRISFGALLRHGDDSTRTGRSMPGLRPRRGSLGQSVVEFALIVPITLLLLGGALDMGRLFYARVSIENAAREGAIFGARNPRCDTSARMGCSDPNTAHWRVTTELSGIGGLTTTFSCLRGGSAVALTDCRDGDSYLASVSTDFDFVTPLLEPLLGGTMTIDATATASVLNRAHDPAATPFVIPTPTP